MILSLLLKSILLCIGGTNANFDSNETVKSEKQLFGYDYPKPSVPFNTGYVYDKPSCPLTLPSTSYITVSVTETNVVMTTAAPVTSTQLETTTEFVTLPRLTELRTETKTETSTTTSTNVLTSTTTKLEIQPTTITSYITSTYCAPNTYLPPEPPKNSYLPPTTTSAPPPPPPPPSNTYLPAHPPQLLHADLDVEQTTPNSFLQSFAFAQAGPIKRATKDIDENTLEEPIEADLPDLSSSSSEVSYESAVSSLNTSNVTIERIPAPPRIDIFYLESRSGGPMDLMQWLLCRFNLVNVTCLD